MNTAELPELPSFTGLYNVRDLGGRRTNDGRMTKYRKYVRSAAADALSETAKDALYHYGIRLIVDLRYESEILKTPNPLAGYRDIQYETVDLLNDFVPQLGPLYQDMGDLYIAWLEHSRAPIARVFRLFADHPDDGVLFHCSVGKDRTGLIAALLLGLAGCAPGDLIADYAESYHRLAPSPLYREAPPEFKPYLLSEPSYMEKTLRHLDHTYGGIAAYLRSIGLSAPTLAAITEGFFTPPCSRFGH